MFSRAAKSIVKVIGQRKYHAGEENIKVAMIGGAGEIGRSLSQMLKQTSKLDVLALYDVAAANKKFSIPSRFHSFTEGDSMKPISSKMLTMLEKSRTEGKSPQIEGNYVKTPSPQNETEKLVEALHRLPIAEQAATGPAINSSKPIQGGNELRGPRVLGEMGPESLLRGGRIVSEIRRQLPGLVEPYLTRNQSKPNFLMSDCLATRIQPSIKETITNEWTSLTTNEDTDTVIEITKNEIRLRKRNETGCRTISLKPEKNGATVRANFDEKSSTPRNSSNLLIDKLKNKTQLQKRVTKKPGIAVLDSVEVDVVRKHVSKEPSCFKFEEIDLTSKNSIAATENPFESKAFFKKRDAKKQQNVPFQNPVDKKLPKESDHSAMSQRILTKRIRDSRIIEEAPKRGSKRTDNSEKSKNWTIPPALSNRKPRTLYGLVQQKRGPLSWFFTRLFDMQNTAIKDAKYKGYKIGKLGCIQDQKLFGKCGLNSCRSAKTLIPEIPEESLCQEAARVTELSHGDDSNNVQESAKNLLSNDLEKMASSNDESENESTSDISEPPIPPKKMSSRIASFLESLNLKRLMKRKSLTSLASYNLDSLFVIEEPVPVFSDPISSTNVLFSSSDSGSKLSLRERIAKKLGRKKGKQDEICKKRQTCKQAKSSPPCPVSCGKKKETTCPHSKKKKEATCAKPCPPPSPPPCPSACAKKTKDAPQPSPSPPCPKKKKETTCPRACPKKKKESPCPAPRPKGCSSAPDPCKCVRNDKHGSPCKQYEEDEKYGKKHDSCKKTWNDEVHGKQCKGEDSSKKVCKSHSDDSNKYDALEKLWSDDTHGKRCKKSCGKQEDPCPKKPDPCPKKQDPCPKKQDPCPKKQDPCPKKQDPCPKKPEPCPKKQPSCGKCGAPKKKPEPCKKPEPKRQKSCTKPCKKKDDKKDKCPPVIRAPGCEEDKKGEGDKGDGKSCTRQYSTSATIMYTRSDFSHEFSKVDLPKQWSLAMKTSRLNEADTKLDKINSVISRISRY